MKDTDRSKLMARARRHIERRTELAFDVASGVGQMFNNVRHMRWFLVAVASELEGNEEA